MMFKKKNAVLLTLAATLLSNHCCDAIFGGEYEVILMKSLRDSYSDFQPRGIVDCGANKGEFTVLTQQIFPNSKFLMLDGTPDKDAVLKEIKDDAEKRGQKVDYSIGVLSERSGEKVTYYQGGDTGNSMFKENTRGYAADKGVERITTTLDEMVENSSVMNLEDVDILKLDVQGAESLVLKGGMKTLKQATFVMLELSYIEWNAGGDCYYDMDEFMRGEGFYMYDFGEIGRNPGAFKTYGVGHTDVLYVNLESPRLPQFLKTQLQVCGVNRQKTVGASTESYTTLDRDLPYYVGKRHRRPETYFFLGVTCGVLGMLAFRILMVALRSKSKRT